MHRLGLAPSVKNHVVDWQMGDGENLDPENGAQIERRTDGNGLEFAFHRRLVLNGQTAFDSASYSTIRVAIRSSRK